MPEMQGYDICIQWAEKIIDGYDIFSLLYFNELIHELNINFGFLIFLALT